jgi:KDO2-lipid IV(A) lauroyltransferase
MELPFFGRPCLTSRAPAIMAMRYKGVLFVPICYRTSLGRWRIEIGEPIATHQDGSRRSVEAITRDMNTAMEVAIQRDPANWFWVHNRWKMSAPAAPDVKVESADPRGSRHILFPPIPLTPALSPSEGATEKNGN